MVGSKDGSSESRLISAHQVPLWLSGFGNQMTLALNASLTTYRAVQCEPKFSELLLGPLKHEDNHTTSTNLKSLLRVK